MKIHIGWLFAPLAVVALLAIFSQDEPIQSTLTEQLALFQVRSAELSGAAPEAQTNLVKAQQHLTVRLGYWLDRLIVLNALSSFYQEGTNKGKVLEACIAVFYETRDYEGDGCQQTYDAFMIHLAQEENAIGREKPTISLDTAKSLLIEIKVDGSTLTPRAQELG